jgi:hypothetical protein
MARHRATAMLCVSYHLCQTPDEVTIFTFTMGPRSAYLRSTAILDALTSVSGPGALYVASVPTTWPHSYVLRP